MKRVSLKWLPALCVVAIFPIFCQASPANIPDPAFYRREPPGGSIYMFLLAPSGNRIEIVWRRWENIDIDKDTIAMTYLIRKALKARGARDVSLQVRDEALRNPGCTITVNAGSDKSHVPSGILYSVISCTGDTNQKAPTPNTERELFIFADFIVNEVGRARNVSPW